MDDADAGRQPVDLGQDVAGHEDRHALITGEGAQELADLDHPGWVEPVGRLVEHEQLWLAEQRAGEREALEVAQRQRPGAATGVLGRGRAVRWPPRRHRRSVDARQSAGDIEVLADGQLRVRDRRLDEMADPPPEPGRVGPDALAEQLGVARGRPDHAQQHPDRGGLAGAVEAQERVDLAAGHAQVHPIDGEHAVRAAIALGQAARGDRELGYRGTSPIQPGPRSAQASSWALRSHGPNHGRSTAPPTPWNGAWQSLQRGAAGTCRKAARSWWTPAWLPVRSARHSPSARSSCTPRV